jgi:hypothetical protein
MLYPSDVLGSLPFRHGIETPFMPVAGVTIVDRGLADLAEEGIRC